MTHTSKPAPIFRRLGAILYDSILLFAFLMLASAISYFVTFGHGINILIIKQLYYIAAGALFFIWSWTHGGRTVGMMVWKLKLVDHNDNPLKLKQALLRYILSIPSFWLGIGIIYCLLDDDKQTLHDKFSKSRVIFYHAPKKIKV